MQVISDFLSNMQPYNTTIGTIILVVAVPLAPMRWIMSESLDGLQIELMNENETVGQDDVIC